jgi:formylglycine-generating enzyme required for sulfatase activity
MDFGIAKAEGLSLTKTGFSVGTPYYMSPEQVRGEKPTDLVDIYAFGVLLCELLIGKKPVEGETLERLFYAVLNESLNPEPMVQAGVPKPVIGLVLRCTEKKPEARPQSFREVIAALEAARTKPQNEPATPAPRRMPVAIIAAIAAVAVVVVIAVVMALKPSAPVVVVTKPKELASILTTETGEMVLAPAGAFLSGEGKQSATVAAFYIDKTEVPWSAYAKFCQAKKRPMPPGYEAAKPGNPAVNITFVDAEAFAKWAEKRLPTPLEWEKAARGADGRIYSWGNEADAGRANVSDNPSAAHAPMPVSSFDQYPGPYKTLNMTGNVWEFVDDLRTPSAQAVEYFAAILKPPPTAAEPWCTIRGGSFKLKLPESTVYEWTSVPVRFAAPDIGFRCARNAE